MVIYAVRNILKTYLNEIGSETTGSLHLAAPVVIIHATAATTVSKWAYFPTRSRQLEYEK